MPREIAAIAALKAAYQRKVGVRFVTSASAGDVFCKRRWGSRSAEAYKNDTSADDVALCVSDDIREHQTIDLVYIDRSSAP